MICEDQLCICFAKTAGVLFCMFFGRLLAFAFTHH